MLNSKKSITAIKALYHNMELREIYLTAEEAVYLLDDGIMCHLTWDAILHRVNVYQYKEVYNTSVYVED